MNFMAYDLYAVIASWQEIGIFGIALPFLLIFTLSFAILEKTKILGNKQKNLNTIVSFVLGLLFIQNVYLVESLQIFLPKIAYALLFFLMFLLLMGVFTGKAEAFKKWVWVPVILAAIALIWASTSDVEGYGGILGWWAGINDEVKSWLVIAIFLALVIFLVHKSGESGGGGGGGGRGTHP